MYNIVRGSKARGLRWRNQRRRTGQGDGDHSLHGSIYQVTNLPNYQIHEVTNSPTHQFFVEATGSAYADAMAEIEYLHVCDLAFAAEGGKQCIIGIFDVISVSAFPATHPTMSIAARFRGSPHEVVPLKIELSRPNGDVLTSIEATITLGPDGSMFMQANLAGLQFPEPGRYTFKVLSGGRALQSHTLHLQKIQAPRQPGPQGTPPATFH